MRGLHEALAETELAAWIVGQIGQLYGVERNLREQNAGPQLRGALWQSRQVLGRLHRAVELIWRRTLPQGLLGPAIDYVLKRWEALIPFVEDGALEIDNSICENSITCINDDACPFIRTPNIGINLLESSAE